MFQRQVETQRVRPAANFNIWSDLDLDVCNSCLVHFVDIISFYCNYKNPLSKYHDMKKRYIRVEIYTLTKITAVDISATFTSIQLMYM